MRSEEIIIRLFIGYALLFILLMVLGVMHIGELAASTVTKGTVQATNSAKRRYKSRTGPIILRGRGEPH